MGTTNILLHSLLAATDDQFSSPAKLEASFPLTSSTQEPSGQSGEMPAVGVSVVLKNDAMNLPQETDKSVNGQSAKDYQVPYFKDGVRVVAPV